MLHNSQNIFAYIYIRSAYLENITCQDPCLCIDLQSCYMCTTTNNIQLLTTRIKVDGYKLIMTFTDISQEKEL